MPVRQSAYVCAEDQSGLHKRTDCSRVHRHTQYQRPCQFVGFVERETEKAFTLCLRDSVIERIDLTDSYSLCLERMA